MLEANISKPNKNQQQLNNLKSADAAEVPGIVAEKNTL